MGFISNLIRVGPKKAEYYKDICVHADENLHVQCIDLLKKYLPPPASIMDCGAGEGAFSLRLRDNGYDVDACDIDNSQFKPKGIEVKQIDFNQSIPPLAKRYDGVVAVEIIEHLENPYKFIDDLSKLTKPGGIILLSTPNISCFAGRYMFLRKGEFFEFGETAWKIGHINPLLPKELEMILKKYNQEIIYKGPGGTLPLFHINCRRLLILIERNIIIPFFRLFMGSKDINGWSLIYIMRNSNS